MRFKMKYGQEELTVELPDKGKILILNSSEESLKNEEEIIKNALENPISSPKLREIVKPGERICIVVSDITRSWQRMDKFLPYLIEELLGSGIKEEDIFFLAATGSHRQHTQQEKELLLGKELAQRFKLFDHNCYDYANLVNLGITSYGTPVAINRLAIEADHLILTGGIVFHDLAGWGGGKKSILPGIAAYHSIMANHSLALAEKLGEGIKKEVRSGIAKGNPVHEDMVEAAKLVKPSFIFNVIIGRNGKISQAVAGHYLEAHWQGCQLVKEMYGVKIAEKADLVIASAGGYPKDINLYQASKALVNASYAVKDGGYVILLAECREGLGHQELKEIISRFKNNWEREKYLRNNYSIAKYTGFLITSIAEKINTLLVSNLSQDIFPNKEIRIVPSLATAFKLVQEGIMADSRIYIMPDAASTMPEVEGGN